MSVCAVCGVAVAESRSGRLVHLDEIPRGIDPDHEIRDAEAAEYVLKQDREEELRLSASAMLSHHTTLHFDDCDWARRLVEALKR